MKLIKRNGWMFGTRKELFLRLVIRPHPPKPKIHLARKVREGISVVAFHTCNGHCSQVRSHVVVRGNHGESSRGSKGFQPTQPSAKPLEAIFLICFEPLMIRNHLQERSLQKLSCATRLIEGAARQECLPRRQ